MSSLAVKYFDTLAFVKECKKLGSSEKLAEYQVREYEKALEVAVNNMKDEIKFENLATKKDLEVLKSDLQKEIIHSRNQMILWVAGFFVATGLINHFFK